jgi:ABC-type nickel/cobalt efflux system permease component RcnA
MVDSVITSSYAAVAIVGLIHGLEPGHGWPVAALLSLKRNSPLLYGFASSSILSAAHFLSSVAVLLVYYLAAAFIDFTSPYFRYLVVAVLLILAIRFFTEKAGEFGRGPGMRCNCAW